MNILIADDSAEIRKNLIKLIKPIVGVMHISESRDGTSAIQALTTFPVPDIIILDIHMPRGTGIDVMSYIKVKNIKVKVVVLTNYATEYYRKKSMELGAEYFFDKSKEFNKVITLLSSMNITRKGT